MVSVPGSGGTTAPRSGWSPAIRLLVDRSRKIAWRPGAVGAALVARAVRMRAYAVWPSTRHPRIAADLGHAASAEWLRRTFEPDASPRHLVGAATWSAVRARGLVVGPPSRLVAEAVRKAAGRDIEGLRLGLYSPTGQSISKASCFLFEHGADEPVLVVKAMPEPRYSARLRHETDIVEAFRSDLGPASRCTAALPLPPLYAGTAAGEYTVVQLIDPLAAGTGRLGDTAQALAWLREFQDATTRAVRAWEEADTEVALDPVRYAWERARPTSAAVVIARAERLLQTLEGQPVRRCGVHGDFWRDNIAERNGRLRIYDWEWAHREGPPFFDLWTSELGLLRRRAEDGEPDLLEPAHKALARVSAEHGRQGVDPRFALATLAPSVGRLVFRVRRAFGVPGGAEHESVRLMAAVESLLR
jgi:hypothetical protein